MSDAPTVVAAEEELFSAFDCRVRRLAIDTADLLGGLTTGELVRALAQLTPGALEHLISSARASRVPSLGSRAVCDLCADVGHSTGNCAGARRVLGEPFDWSA